MKVDGKRILDEWLQGKSPEEIAQDELERQQGAEEDPFSDYDGLNQRMGGGGPESEGRTGPDTQAIDSAIRPTGPAPAGPVSMGGGGGGGGGHAHKHSTIDGRMVDA